ncbi:zinc transporter ZntB [Erythrobacteraceae bacterium CFH 75059]|uniref:CorA family divalent cation transporter n=1 Tax=Qipengyuania thermophila TaxID=2509361 RepID=UPI0010216C28|nr:CorA family divalent cation transporter [Qipengyuania thermophila]TCD06394.1 zinc transporter ZntB [Erythrobacteraceae bacterium CFH 75059]
MTRAEMTASDGPLLFGRVLDGAGGGAPITWDEARDWRPERPGAVLWLHLDRTLPEVRAWLLHTLSLPEPTAELLTSDDTRPRAFREGETLVATLRTINFNPGAEPEDMVSMQLWSDGTRVLTFRRHWLQGPRQVLALVDGGGPGPTDAGALITSLVEHMIHHMNHSVIDMNEQIDALFAVDGADDRADDLLGRISAIRRDCLALKRHMGPEHVALEAIARDAPGWFEPHDRREIGESIALLRRFLDDIDVSKESAVVLMDEIRGRSLARSERTNRLLTVVATVFLPLTFLTGLLGMNVEGIPAAEHPLAFWSVVGLCGVVLIVQVMLFRRWRWL